MRREAREMCSDLGCSPHLPGYLRAHKERMAARKTTDARRVNQAEARATDAFSVMHDRDYLILAELASL